MNAGNVDLAGVALIFEIVDDRVQLVDQQLAVLELQLEQTDRLVNRIFNKRISLYSEVSATLSCDCLIDTLHLTYTQPKKHSIGFLD